MSVRSVDALYSARSGLLATEVDGDVVMLDMHSGDFYNLSGIGSFLWNLLESPKSISELVISVCEEYDVDDAQALSDVELFLQNLSKDGLVIKT